MLTAEGGERIVTVQIDTSSDFDLISPGPMRSCLLPAGFSREMQVRMCGGAAEDSEWVQTRVKLSPVDVRALSRVVTFEVRATVLETSHEIVIGYPTAKAASLLSMLVSAEIEDMGSGLADGAADGATDGAAIGVADGVAD